ncbi:MAG TPA: TMEM175 family protein [Actinomycetota bacterium]|nr:TMEM175 family protein [Actinomycetota bacterium]
MNRPGRPQPPIDLSAGRLEAFSDAVMAVIITILALGLHPPEGTTWVAVRDDPLVLPGLAIYVLSFSFVAIYWNNHHHLLRATTLISGAVMWANMVLLFCLSLIPVATEWLRSGYHDPAPAAFFGVVGLASALAYSLLVRAIIRANGRDSLVGTAIHADLKGKLSLAMYAAGIALAFVSVWLAYALYAAVAIMWLVPDRRFMHAHADEGTNEP